MSTRHIRESSPDCSDVAPVEDDFPHEEFFDEWDGPAVHIELHGSARSQQDLRDEYDRDRSW